VQARREAHPHLLTSDHVLALMVEPSFTADRTVHGPAAYHTSRRHTMFAKLKSVYENPTYRKYALLAASYAAGAYGGPVAAQAVQSHGPAIVNVIAHLFGG
jgi:hypothetical protein